MASSSNQATMPSFEEAKEVPASWSIVHESYFIDLMIVKVQGSGEDRVLGGFSKHVWGDIRKQYYVRFRLKHSLKIILGWDPILCTVEASNEWWDNHLKNFPRDKVFRENGCPEYSKLEIIYGDTVATGKLRQTQDGGFDSSDDEDGTDMFEHYVPQASPIPPLHGSTQVSSNNGVAGDLNDGYMDNQSRVPYRNPSGSNRSTHENKANEIGESLKILAENAKTKLEDKTKYSISECLELLDSMGTLIGKATYVKAIKVLQDKGWRETFIKMSEDRRNDWIDSIENGDF
ncbi:hypothetical protein MKX03_000736 [Papaver bracteatum]|nr:hypothetical protein MKX03_000736 [Papaver bracteatum]